MRFEKISLLCSTLIGMTGRMPCRGIIFGHKMLQWVFQPNIFLDYSMLAMLTMYKVNCRTGHDAVYIVWFYEHPWLNGDLISHLNSIIPSSDYVHHYEIFEDV